MEGGAEGILHRVCTNPTAINVIPSPGAGDLPGALTGIERECLRQAIHDVRGPLNTSSVLVDLIAALLDKDPQLARSKAPLVVRELQTVARMLDHLVGSSDTLAMQTTTMDLGVSLDGVVHSFATPATALSVLRDSAVRLGDGSGAFVSADGLIITNQHVAMSCAQRRLSPGG